MDLKTGFIWLVPFIILWLFAGTAAIINICLHKNLFSIATAQYIYHENKITVNNKLNFIKIKSN